MALQGLHSNLAEERVVNYGQDRMDTASRIHQLPKFSVDGQPW